MLLLSEAATRVFLKKGILKNFAEFRGLKSATLLK